MPDKVILVRGDGTKLEATPEQAERLSILGYRPETADEHVQANVGRAESEYYGSAGQQAIAAAEGVGAGLSFGATDYFGDREQTAKRAEYNPGTRIASEILGAVAPLVLSGGKSAEASTARVADKLVAEKLGSRLAQGTGSAETVTSFTNEASTLSKLASKAPTSILSDAARALAPGKEGTLVKAISSGALEGSIYGASGAVDHSYLDGTPLTSEAVLHGIGWGTLLGGALSGIGHGIGVGGEAVKAELDRPAVEAAKRAEGRAKRLADYDGNVKAYEKGEAERIAAHEAAVGEAKAAEAARVAKAREAPVPKGALDSTAGADYAALKAETKNLSNNLKQAADSAYEGVTNSLTEAAEQHAAGVTFDSTRTFLRGVAKEEIAKAKSLFEQTVKLTESGKLEKASEAAQEYASHVTSFGKSIGMDMPSPAKALENFIATKVVNTELARLPRTVEGFASMSQASLDRLTGSLEKMQSLGISGTEVVQDAVKNLAKSLGLDGADLASIHKAAKVILKQEGVAGVPNPAEKIVPPKLGKAGSRPKLGVLPEELKEPRGTNQLVGDREKPGFVQHLLGYMAGGKAYVAARGVGLGRAGGYAAYRGARDLVINGTSQLSGIRAHALGAVKQAVADYSPGVSRAIKGGAGSSGLATTLYGEQDTSTKDKAQLAYNRVKEIHEFAPTAANSLFKVVEPLGGTQPDLAKGMHAASLSAFQALQEITPKDSGVLSRLKTIWRPSDVQALMLGKQLEVFHAPLQQAVEMLNTNSFDPIKVEALRKFAPSIWQEMRVGVLERVSQPGVLDKMSYNEQIGLGLMLDIPIHSSMAPEYIASSQQMFLERNQPLQSNPRIGQNGGAPNPADNANATSAQKTESH